MSWVLKFKQDMGWLMLKWSTIKLTTVVQFWSKKILKRLKHLKGWSKFHNLDLNKYCSWITFYICTSNRRMTIRLKPKNKKSEKIKEVPTAHLEVYYLPENWSYCLLQFYNTANKIFFHIIFFYIIKVIRSCNLVFYCLGFNLTQFLLS